MTHSNHRQGTRENLHDDYVVLAFGQPRQTDVMQRLARFRELAFGCRPVNVPGIRSHSTFVFDHKDKVRYLLDALATANLELSITVSGPFDQVVDCCRATGLFPHTVNRSFGFWGNTERLPSQQVLEITTMCGHGRVSPHLVFDKIDRIRRGHASPDAAAREMSKLCLCTIFNDVRARKLIAQLAAVDMVTTDFVRALSPVGSVTKVGGISVNPKKCSGCLDCIPLCPWQALVDTGDGRVVVDAGRCTECGLCWHSAVCQTSAIEASDLAWPRLVRGRFQSVHAPYNQALASAAVAHPIDYTSRERVYNSVEIGRVELGNDASNFIKRGAAVIVLECGRPHTGVKIGEIQKLTVGLASSGYIVADHSPIVAVMADRSRGTLKSEVLDEIAGNVHLNFLVSEADSVRCLATARELAKKIDAVFAVSVISRVSLDGTAMADRIAAQIGVVPAPNCKTNVGLAAKKAS